LQEAEELCDLREALETFAVEKAIENVSDDGLYKRFGKMNVCGFSPI